MKKIAYFNYLVLLKNIYRLLSKSQKKYVIFHILLMLICAILEALSIGMVLPLVAGLSNSSSGIYSYYLNLLKINNLAFDNDDSLLIFIIFFLILFLLKYFFLSYFSRRQAFLKNDIESGISNKLLSKIIESDMLYILRTNSSRLLSCVINEAASVAEVIYFFLQLLVEFLLLIILGLMLFIINPYVFILIGIILLISTLLYKILIKNKLILLGENRIYFQEQRIKKISELIKGLKDIKLMAKERFFFESSVSSTNSSLNVNMRSQIYQDQPKLLLDLFASLIVFFIVIALTYGNDNLGSVLGGMALVIAALFRILPSINRIINSMRGIEFGAPSVKALVNDFGNLLIVNGGFGSNLANIENFNEANSFKSLIIKDATFRYPGTLINILEQCNFSIFSGETVAIIGESGSGKSTFINLLLGVFRVQSGEMLANDVSIYDRLSEWHSRIAYVSQDLFFVDDTLKNNIAFGVEESHIDYDRLYKVIKDSQLDSLVQKNIDGINLKLGEGGCNLSGGQRQRVAIARALYRNAEVLIFDEATSALDSTTESKLMDLLIKLSLNLTIIFVTHRLTNLSRFDRIFKIEHKKLIEVINR